MGYFGSLMIAMVTRVTQGHSGGPLVMGHVALASFLAVQAAATARILSELVVAPGAVRWLLFGSLAAWLAGTGTLAMRNAGIYLAPRTDGRPG
jgi:uncharacterized protein involved in response to NO